MGSTPTIGTKNAAEPLLRGFLRVSADEADKKFYEVARFCGAKLITGNIKHFPKDNAVLTVPEFLEQYNLK